MANTIQIDVVSAEESILSEEAEFVVAPAKMGEVGIYPNHASMITLLKAGSVRIKKVNKSDEDLIYISGGILEVQPGILHKQREKEQHLKMKALNKNLRQIYLLANQVLKIQ